MLVFLLFFNFYFFYAQYIDFKMGETSGYIRFEEPEAAQKARAAAVLNEEGGIVVKNYIAALEPVSGKAQPANDCLVWNSFECTV